MKISILRRLETIEKQVKVSEVPELIMINYDWNNKQWCIKETYFEGRQKEKKKLLSHYKDYAISSEFEGTIILDLLDCPCEFEGNLTSFNASDIRKEYQAKHKAFTIEKALEEGIETKFNITMLSYAE